MTNDDQGKDTTGADGVKQFAGLVKPLEWRRSEKVDNVNLVAHCAVSLQTYFAADEIHAAEIDARRAARILAAINTDAIAALVGALEWVSEGAAYAHRSNIKAVVDAALAQITPPLRCQECDCQHGGTDCTWIKSGVAE